MKSLTKIIHKSKIGKALLGLAAVTIIYAGILGSLEKVYGEEDKHNI